MIITFDLTWLTTLLPFVMIGFGVGYFATLRKGSSNTKLDRMKHDLEVKKEWIAMLAERNRELTKREKWNNNVRRN